MILRYLPIILRLIERRQHCPSDQRPLAPPVEPAGMSRADIDAVEDMAAFFRIARREATLLFRIGRALGNPALAQQADVGNVPI
jgi:hypothetical protein